MVAETGRLVGMDIVEVNPILDDRNRTAKLAVDSWPYLAFGNAFCP
jgi:arginase